MKCRYSMPFGAECRDDGSVALSVVGPGRTSWAFGELTGRAMHLEVLLDILPSTTLARLSAPER